MALYYQLTETEQRAVDQERAKEQRELFNQIIKEMKAHKPAPEKSTPEGSAFLEEYLKQMAERAAQRNPLFFPEDK